MAQISPSREREGGYDHVEMQAYPAAGMDEMDDVDALIAESEERDTLLPTDTETFKQKKMIDKKALACLLLQHVSK